MMKERIKRPPQTDDKAGLATAVPPEIIDVEKERKQARFHDTFAEEEVQKRKNVLHLIDFFKLTEDTTKTEKTGNPKKTETSFTLLLPCSVTFFQTYLAHHCFVLDVERMDRV